jgi:ligand-binding sensor domain-containing protein/DNA-binding response OmpR family regulator
MGLRQFFIMLLILIGWCCPTYGQLLPEAKGKSAFGNYALKTYTIADGLPSKNTTAAFKDRRGFIWVGTENGLCRFDGYNFKIFYHKTDDPSSISNNVINTIIEDQKGCLWIGTMDGLNVMNPLTEQFQSFHHHEKQTSSISNSKIWSLLCDRQGVIWIGTDDGFNRYNEANASFTSYLPNPNSENAIVGKSVNAIVEDKDGKLWLGNWSGGLNQFDKRTQHFRNYQQKKPPGLKNPNDIWSLACDDNGSIWVGTYWHGMFNFNPRTNTFKPVLKPNERNPGVYSILPVSDHTMLIGGSTGFFWLDTRTYKWEPLNGLANYIFGDAYQDRDGIIWITAKNGLLKLDRRQYKFTLKPFDVDHAEVKSIVSKDEQLWVGTSRGLYRFDQNSGKRSVFRKEGNQNSLKSNEISKLYFDSKGMLWILTENGFDSYDLQQKVFTHYSHHSPLGNFFNEDVFRDILEIDPGVYYLATDAGLKIYNSHNNTFKHYYSEKNNKYALSNNHLNSLLRDDTGAIWIGTYGGGLNRFDRLTGHFEVFRSSASSGSGLSSDIIWGLFQDAERNIWAATQDGLNKFDFKKRHFTVFSKKDGFSNNVFSDITADHKGNLWITTGNGISSLDPKTKAVKNFDDGDGINVNSTLFNTGKEILLAGSAGLIRFDPLNIHFNKAVPPVYFSDFQLFNKTVVPGPAGPLKENLNMTRQITLNYDQRVFSFEFVGLNYRHSEKNEYAYKLIGFDKKWNYVGAERKASYTNLNPGIYKLWIRASNNDGVWNEEGKTLTIHINPPWYGTWWAYLIYILMIGAVVYGYMVYRNKQEDLKYKIKVASLEREKEKELNEKKLNFFTNISHELRTPLTLIVNPIKDILNQKEAGQEKNDLNIVYRNSRRLLSLVDQLLLFRKTESENDVLKIVQINLSKFTKDIFLCFSYLAKNNNITYTFTSGPEEIGIYADKDKLEIVLFNLLSNALKFTPSGGSVSLTLEATEDEVMIRVIDSGMGIPEDIGEKLFDKFYKIQNNNSLKMGFGIGLYLVKSFVELHKGRISYSSIPGRGTTFAIQMPLNKQYFNGDHLPENDSNELTYVNELIGTDGHEEFRQVKATDTAPVENLELLISDFLSILIVDDNEQIIQYLRQIFQDKFKIYEAFDGIEGLAQSRRFLPDVIISDVNMEGLNGIEFCRAIKDDPALSHIPVILLTADPTPELRLQGIEVGAYDFISKPFDKELFTAKINAVIRNRSNLQSYFFNEVTLKTDTLKVSEEDRGFLQKCIALIEENLMETDFNVKFLASALGMSHSNLYKKIKATSGQSINSFTRFIRLRKAAELLINTNLNINEVAYRVGINDVKYFREQFQKVFKLTPSDFIKKHRNTFHKYYNVNSLL